MNFNITKPSSSGQKGSYETNPVTSQKAMATFLATENKIGKGTCNFCHWCFNCLSSSHKVRNCLMESICIVCTKKHHHVLLHTGKSETSRTNLNPLVTDLPATRAQEASVFSRIGVDYFGPINITMVNKRNASVHKAYVSLFICMSVKAIHLELVSSLYTFFTGV